jgi:hypothetical protein
MVSSHGCTAPMAFTRRVRGYNAAIHGVETIICGFRVDDYKTAPCDHSRRTHLVRTENGATQDDKTINRVA